MDRTALLRGLRRERDQQLHCWRIPFAIASYFIAATSLVLHLQVEPSFFLERGLVDSIVTRTSGVNSVVNTATLFDFLRDELLPAAFPSRTDGVLGAINSYSQILGGIRLSQARSAEQPCPPILGINLTAVLRGAPAECHPESTTSRGAFGLASVAESHNVSSAFHAMDAPASVPAALRAEFDPFEFVIDAHDDLGEAVALVDGLQAALWVDASTKHVTVEIAVLNLEIAAWARLLVTFTFTRGGRVSSAWAVRSLPFDPYSSAPILGAFDVLNILYAAYLLATIAASTWRRAVQAARDSRLPGKGCGGAVASNFDAWWLVDVACALCLVLAFSFWGATVGALQELKSTVGDAAWVPATLADDTLAAHGALEFALVCFRQFKVVGSIALVLLTIRLFWQFSLQPRLAVMTECLSRSAVDMAHFAFLFGVVMFAYAVLGHLLFGTLLEDWSSLPDALYAVTRMAMFHYDLDAMQSATEPAFAAIYFASFMFVIANLLLWMFLAIVMDTYTDVRKAFASAPSAWVDLRRQVIETPRALRASFAHLQAQWRALVSFLRAPGAAMAAAAAEASGHIELSDIGGGNGLSPLQPPPPAALSLAAVITALCEPPLALQHAVSFRDLAALLAVSVEEVEAVCTSWHLLAVLESGRSGGRGGVAAAGRPARGLVGVAQWRGEEEEEERQGRAGREPLAEVLPLPDLGGGAAAAAASGPTHARSPEGGGAGGDSRASSASARRVRDLAAAGAAAVASPSPTTGGGPAASDPWDGRFAVQ